MQKILLITPPFTQLNTPYPATAYLKGFLNTKEIQSFQVDMGIEVILELFSSQGLKKLFGSINPKKKWSENTQRILSLRQDYIQSIDQVIGFLQDQNTNLAHFICTGNYLPEASRFDQLADLEWAFGTMGTRDKARHLATLYLEDLSDLIVETVDPHFGFSRYAERLARSATSFDHLYKKLLAPNSFIDEIHLNLLKDKIEKQKPSVVAISAPFPGNIYSAFKCGQYIKKNYPEIKIVLGGGFPNTELRSISDARIFEFLDFICLDDGETPFINLLEHLDGQRPIEQLKRTFALNDGKVEYFNEAQEADVRQEKVGTPDYSDFYLDKYLSVIEIANPMHRLWNDGRWNKLTMAHGCYWGKCTFCDISLDYIKNYEANSAKLLVDRMEEMIAQTGESGFHFVDEAAPPSLMGELAMEIIRRKITVVWWANIRFEKSFTFDLCQLLAASGCIAISGGLEVASDRLLKLIEKGVTVAQVAKVADNFTQNGIMVHAYLMYGFPTQTVQETVDSLEIVRQLFESNVLQSAFWHQFAMTAHSPVGMAPEKFKVKNRSKVGTFANNDLVHSDPTGCDHDLFAEGLKKSLFNYMHGICFDFPLQEWFSFSIPKTTHPTNYIEKVLSQFDDRPIKDSTKVVWLGRKPKITSFTKEKRGKKLRMQSLYFTNKKAEAEIILEEKQANWLLESLHKISVTNSKTTRLNELRSDFESQDFGPFPLFWFGEDVGKLRQIGLVVL